MNLFINERIYENNSVRRKKLFLTYFDEQRTFLLAVCLVTKYMRCYPKNKTEYSRVTRGQQLQSYYDCPAIALLILVVHPKYLADGYNNNKAGTISQFCLNGIFSIRHSRNTLYVGSSYLKPILTGRRGAQGQVHNSSI